MGEISIHHLNSVNTKLSTQSIISILSTLVAPRLHQNPTKINWFGDSILYYKKAVIIRLHPQALQKPLLMTEERFLLSIYFEQRGNCFK
jgi:hypothetical protein